MSFWKWFLSTGLLLLIAILSTTYVSRVSRNNPNPSLTRKGVSTKKQKESVITHQKSEEHEKKQLERKPSSVTPSQPPPPSTEGRSVMGSIGEKEKSQIDIDNSYNSDWKKKLNKNLKKLLTSRKKQNTELLIRHKKSVIKKSGKNRGKLYEIVTITHIPQNNEKQNTYEALVNSETGEIERTWNRTIHMPSDRDELKTSLRPSGTL